MIKIDIDVTKIPKAKLVEKAGKKYLKAVLVSKPSEYSDGFIAMDVTKEERLAGTRGEIIGNWKELSGGQPAQQQRPETKTYKKGDDMETDDIPF